MRFPRVYEADGTAVVGECHICRGELYGGHYCISGERVCRDCLEEYARRTLAPFWVEEGQA